jgi:hypothetical protein
LDWVSNWCQKNELENCWWTAELDLVGGCNRWMGESSPKITLKLVLYKILKLLNVKMVNKFTHLISK